MFVLKKLKESLMEIHQVFTWGNLQMYTKNFVL